MKPEQIPGLESKSCLVVPFRRGDERTTLLVYCEPDSENPVDYANKLFALHEEVRGQGWVPDWTERFRFQRVIRPFTDEDYRQYSEAALGRKTMARLQDGTGEDWLADVSKFWQDDWTMTRKILEIVAPKLGVQL